ncbi:hypothetical protein [uncultured Ruegeria sp.]|uniref:hypothetical protein n=1 Tax=uncultured Ruegeria sp. TaxID=259304 RepID=UPI00261D9BEC|nr:hypothetical protein [uncultured Ruegeria sp.]
MRFKHWPRHEFNDTSRKRSALRRKQRLEREALPLFAEQICEEQPSEDQVMQDRAQQWVSQEVKSRSERAANWRNARRTLDGMPLRTRYILRRAWNCAPYPADPGYLLGFLHSYNTGRIDIEALPFPLFRTTPSGERVASIFDEQHPELLINILKARDIAASPENFRLEERKAAYHHLQAAAKSNKDKIEAKRDRLRALSLWDSFGVPKLMDMEFVDVIPTGGNWNAMKNSENSLGIFILYCLNIPFGIYI